MDGMDRAHLESRYLKLEMRSVGVKEEQQVIQVNDERFTKRRTENSRSYTESIFIAI